MIKENLNETIISDIRADSSSFLSQIYTFFLISWFLNLYFKPKLSPFIEIMHGFLTLVLISPIILICGILTLIVRTLLTHLVLKNQNLELMNGNDAFWAYEEFANSSTITALYVIRGQCSESKIRTWIRDKVINKKINNELIYEKFKRIAVEKYGFYCWKKVKDLDYETHVRVISNYEKNNEGGMRESAVFREIEKVIDYPMSDKRPQWEILIVPKYKYDEEKYNKFEHYAVIFRLHHSYLDGISCGFILQNCLSDNEPQLAVNPLAPLKMSFFQKFLMYFGIFLYGPRTLIKTLMLEETNMFHGKKLCGPKTIAWSQPIHLPLLKNLKIKTNSSITTILLSSIGGSLRKIALSKSPIIPSSISAFPTVAILPYPDSKPQNRFSVILFPIFTKLGSGAKRLAKTYETAQECGKSLDALVSFYFLKITGLLPSLATKFISKTGHATLLVTNVPGPLGKISIFGGDELVDVGIWAPSRSRIGIGMGMFSYNGRLRSSIISDATSLEKNEVKVLIKEFENEVIDLCTKNKIIHSDAELFVHNF